MSMGTSSEGVGSEHLAMAPASAIQMKNVGASEKRNVFSLCIQTHQNNSKCSTALSTHCDELEHEQQGKILTVNKLVISKWHVYKLRNLIVFY